MIHFIIITLIIILISTLITMSYKTDAKQIPNIKKEPIISYAFLKKLLIKCILQNNKLILTVFIKKEKSQCKSIMSHFNYYLNKCINTSSFNAKLEKEKQDLQKNLESYTKKTVKYILSCNNMSLNDLYYYFEDNFPEDFSTYESFNVFGDTKSIDIDLILSVDHLEKPLLSSEQNRLEIELNTLGYNMEKPIDYNLVIFEDGNVKNCKKGGSEIQNILYYTYKAHPQKYLPLVNKIVKVNIHNKAMSINKFIMNYLNAFVFYDYKVLSKKKAVAYSKGGLELVKFTISMWDNFILNSNDPHFSRDVWKSLTVKYIQLLALYTNVYYELDKKKRVLYYSKDGMYKLVPLILKKLNVKVNKIDLICIKQLLFRENCNNFNIMKIFHDKFADIIITTYPKFINPNINILNKIKNTTTISNELFDLYLKSPIQVNENFSKLWVKLYGQNIQQAFIEKCTNTDLLIKKFPELINKIHLEPQCSDKWKYFLDYYSCGKNTGITELLDTDLSLWQIIQKRSNLIMGMIGESICFGNINLIPEYKDYDLITIGLLVKEKFIRNSKGCAPDGLLVSKNNKIIMPIEIKTIASKPTDNSIFRREYILGTKQLGNACDILNHNNIIIADSGLLIILWIYKDDNEWKFEMYSEIINTLSVFY
jgi:hypothetical protein